MAAPFDRITDHEPARDFTIARTLPRRVTYATFVSSLASARWQLASLPHLERITMARSRVGTVSALIALGVVGYVGARPVGPLPPLGALLDPANGLFASVQTAELPTSASTAIPGVGAPVNVTYDDRGVPHIFAANSRDAYRALGYVVARDRLFQIELQTRAGGGTLTELVGDRALPLDQATRALGMPRAAEQRVSQADTTTASWQMMRAYADGINAWIAQLSRRDLPLEYKLLGREPRTFSALDVMHLLNRMGYTLASSEDELRHMRAAARVGRAAADALFPVHAPIVEPIQPNGQSTHRVDAIALATPGAPDSLALALVEQLGNVDTRVALGLPARQPDAVGSNNWAVSPSRSASGHALLVGDPHLELTMPSIWYEAHMVVADSLDVYGVTIPGLPGIVIGFNRDVAWTFTNVGADVMDFYLERVDDPVNPARYQLDGEWQPLERRVERYLNGDGALISEDTLRYTHRGPLRRVNDRWISHRWTVLEGPARELEAFDRAARATTAQALLDELAQWFRVPAQNMLVADRSGTIGIRSTGRYPIRPDSGRGDVLRDGSSRRSDWIGDWSIAEYPQAFSPAQGYLASANQEPLDPRVQPRYLGSDWERPWRAIRINELLRANNKVTPDDMRAYQTEPRSARADAFVPVFVQVARDGPPRPSLVRAGQLLAAWDRRYTTDNTAALLFEAAMSELSTQLYDELLESASGGVSSGPRPSDMMTAILLNEPTSAWWDYRGSSEVENRDAIMADALETAYDELVAQFGQPESAEWQWSKHRTANINHLLRMPTLSRLNIPMQGGSGTLNPSTGAGTHGASWRMVVELGPEIRAQAIYPGGQSGHPASERYDDRLAAWTAGRLDTLRVPRTANELTGAHVRATLTITPAGTP
jgi:penicillin amidase